MICDLRGKDAEVGGASSCYLDLMEPPCWEESLLHGQVTFSPGGSSGFCLLKPGTRTGVTESLEGLGPLVVESPQIFVFIWRFCAVGFTFVCYEYVLLSLVNKEANLVYSRVEYK